MSQNNGNFCSYQILTTNLSEVVSKVVHGSTHMNTENILRFSALLYVKNAELNRTCVTDICHTQPFEIYTKDIFIYIARSYLQ